MARLCKEIPCNNSFFKDDFNSVLIYFIFVYCKKMGCENSTCMLPKNEVEIDIDDKEALSKIVILRPESKIDNPSIYIKDYVDQIPDLAKLNQRRSETSPNHRGTKVRNR